MTIENDYLSLLTRAIPKMQPVNDNQKEESLSLMSLFLAGLTIHNGGTIIINNTMPNKRTCEL